MKNKISAVLIVKNEVKVLARCIESLGGLDQIVVHDTGSTDGTQDLARKLGADVSSTKIKPFHFALARNEARKKATGDWVLSIDADEVLVKGGIGAIRDAVGKKPASIFRVRHVDMDPTGNSTLPTWKKRIFLSTRYEWKWRVHERLFSVSNAELAENLPDCILKHRPAAKRTKRRAQNLKLLRMCVLESPEHVYALRQLGFELALAEKWAECLTYLERYVDNPMEELLHEKCATLMMIGQARARLKDLEGACRAFMEAHEDSPRRREPLYWAATELIRAARPWDAIWWLEKCLTVASFNLPEFSLNSEAVHGTLVAETLAECRDVMEKAQKAHEARHRG